MNRARRSALGAMALLLAAGCASAPRGSSEMSFGKLERRALDVLKAAIRYQHNPAVRVAAIEALASCQDPKTMPWLRSALLDDQPAVRFAGCVALGELGEASARGALRDRVNDSDPNVQIAALFALHRLGDTTRTGSIPNYLYHEDAAVRRNAALLLGRLEEPGAIKVLARAMRDRDAGVRHHALEAMARLGNAEAKQELVFMTNAGVGSEEVFAISALAQTGDPAYLDAFRYKLRTAIHLETRLAAARGMGLLGADDGFELALRALRAGGPTINIANDPEPGQILRKRQLAAAALGAMGKTEALPPLAKVMDDPTDPRIQVSAAKAIVEISKANRQDALPFARPRSRSRP